MTLIQFYFFILVFCVIGLCFWNLLKIREIHITMNSRLDQLLQSSMGEAHAAGVEQERSRETLRQSVRYREAEQSIAHSEANPSHDEDKT